jgi:IS5 family transposase
MKPKKTDVQRRIFETPLDQIINMEHPLVILSSRIDWAFLEETFGKLYVPHHGRPGLPTRLMTGLHYLKYAFDHSDESAVETFLENPYWQYFCGQEYFVHDLPLDPSSMTRWRKRLNKGDSEALLKETIQTALRMNVMKPKEVCRVNVDTTVQEKAVAYPTDARNYNKGRKLLVKIAKKRGIELRQSYARVGEELLRKQARYAYARQMNRSAKVTKQLRTYLGRVIRELEHGCEKLTKRENEILELVKRLHAQKREDKNKVYSIHAPEVECIAKGKAHKKYEFGCKASVVSTNGTNWIVGADACHGIPYDGHTLVGALSQVKRLTGTEVKEVYCDKGYRLKKGEAPNDCRMILPDGRKRSAAEKKRMKRRNAIEPIIGHMKFGNRLSRNYLRGVLGDVCNVIFAACGFNIRKLLRAFLYLQFRSFLRNFLSIKCVIKEALLKNDPLLQLQGCE